MNVFGVGAAELLAILLIMLVFAGPKRMIHWSYILGQHVSKFRRIWSETVDLVQKEFDDAGVGIQLPKEPPTRQNINRSLSAAVKPMTKPLQDSVDEVKKDLNSVQKVSDELNNKKPKTRPAAAKKKLAVPTPALVASTAKTPRPKTASKPATAAVNLGTWSRGTPAADNGKTPHLGAWSRAESEMA